MLAYVGCGLWLYEKPLAAAIACWLVVGWSACWSLIGAWLAFTWRRMASPTAGDVGARLLARPAQPAGLLLGFDHGRHAAGPLVSEHPSMQLAPLRAAGAADGGGRALRAVVCAIGLGLECAQAPGWPSSARWLFLALRWLAGIFGRGRRHGWMTWQTLKIPNTQSATGILYVAVITVFLANWPPSYCPPRHRVSIYDGEV